MGFAALLGHSKQLDSLCRALEGGRLHHAYLFVGPDGVGKRTIAVALAKALHCGEAVNDFCDVCVNCRRIRDGNHSDVRLVQPLPDKKEIGIPQIRQMEKELNLRAFSGSGSRKIVIIDPAPLLNVPAQNALLKTLEEPPRESLLILVGANGGGLLPTVRSRCLSISFGPLSREVIARCLISQGLHAERAAVLAAMSMGSLGTAMNLNQKGLPELRRQWIASVGSLAPRDYRGAMEAAEALSADREESLQFLDWLQSWYRDLLVYRVTHGTHDLINLDMAGEIERHSAVYPAERLVELIELAAGAGGRVQRNLNRRMVVEDILLKAVEER